MKILLSICAIALLGTAIGDEIPTEDNVLVLTKPLFEDVVSKTEFILVEFCKFAYFSSTIHLHQIFNLVLFTYNFIS